MEQSTDQSAASDGKAYLAAVEELTMELQRAIAAVAQGALSEFEDSVVRQRIGCMRVAELASLHAGMAAPSSDGDSSLLVQRTREATSHLKEVTHYYAMLLKHFGDTTRLFAGMFRTYDVPAKKTFHVPRSQSTWSCEL